MSPQRSAVGASMKRPVSSMSRACFRLTLRATATPGVEQNNPYFTPEVAKRQSSLAMARSQAATSWQPAAVAMPWGAAITGTGTDWMVDISWLQTAKTSRSSSRVRSIISFRSWPAEKARPAPLRTMARTSGRAAWRSSSDVSSSIRPVESALSCSGRLSVMTAAGGVSSTSRKFRETAIANLLVAAWTGRHADCTPAITKYSLPRGSSLGLVGPQRLRWRSCGSIRPDTASRPPRGRLPRRPAASAHRRKPG